MSHAAEVVLVVTGAVSLAAYGWFTIQIRRLETENRSAVSRMLSERVAIPETPDLMPMPTPWHSYRS